MHLLKKQLRDIQNKIRPVIPVCLFGLGGSLTAVGFMLCINWIFNHCYREPAQHGFWHFAWVSLAVITTASLLVGILLEKFRARTGGNGVPQAKLAFWKDFGYSPRLVAPVKFLAGVIGIGGGLSLGREGPSVQLGSNVASTIAGALGIAKPNRRAANAAGAGAGLAAAFNAPLGSVAFVLEEIVGDLNSPFIGGILLAAVASAFVVHAIIGPQPAFELARISEPTWRAYLLMPIAAGFAAFVGVWFQRIGLKLRATSNHLRSIPKWLHPLAGGLGTWIIGISVFAATGRLGVFALGFDDLSEALTHGLAWQIAAALLIGKMAATLLCFSFGGYGGVFSPNLFFGAMAGACIAGISSHFLALTHADIILLAVGGMSAGLGAVVQAPVTAILIIFEMTHQFALIPGLMLAGLVSQVIARSLNPVNFYDGVLLQDGHKLDHIIPPRDLRSWEQLPISAIAQFKPVVINDLSEAALSTLLESHPYRCFPVVNQDGNLGGVAVRNELETAIQAHRPPAVIPAVTCQPGEVIQEIQNRFIESSAGFLVLTDQPCGKPLGVVTLHDVLRAQHAMSERERTH